MHKYAHLIIPQYKLVVRHPLPGEGRGEANAQIHQHELVVYNSPPVFRRGSNGGPSPTLRGGYCTPYILNTS